MFNHFKARMYFKKNPLFENRVADYAERVRTCSYEIKENRSKKHINWVLKEMDFLSILFNMEGNSSKYQTSFYHFLRLRHEFDDISKKVKKGFSDTPKPVVVDMLETGLQDLVFIKDKF